MSFSKTFDFVIFNFSSMEVLAQRYFMPYAVDLWFPFIFSFVRILARFTELVTL